LKGHIDLHRKSASKVKEVITELNLTWDREIMNGNETTRIDVNTTRIQIGMINKSLNEVNGLKNESIKVLGLLGDLDIGGLFEFEKFIDNTMSFLFEMKGILKHISSYTNIAGYSTVIVLLLPSCLILGIALSTIQSSKIKKTYSKYLSCCILPLFILTIMIYIVGLVALGVTSSMNADACENPEDTITKILEAKKVVPGGITEQLINFYVLSGCQEHLRFLEPQLSLVEEAIVTIRRFSLKLGELDSKPLNTGNCTAIQDSLNDFTNLMLGMEFEKNISLTECKHIHDSYKIVGYDEICTHTMKNVSFMFFFIFLILLSGMMMITLRGVIWPGLAERKIVTDIDNGNDQELVALADENSVMNNRSQQSSWDDASCNLDVRHERKDNWNLTSAEQQGRINAESSNLLKEDLNIPAEDGNGDNGRSVKSSVGSRKSWDLTRRQSLHTTRDSETESWDFTPAEIHHDRRQTRSIRKKSSPNWDFETVECDDEKTTVQSTASMDDLTDFSPTIVTLSEMTLLESVGGIKKLHKK